MKKTACFVLAMVLFCGSAFAYNEQTGAETITERADNEAREISRHGI